MLAKTLMVQGTASNVGKSFLVAGLCRIFASRGHSVTPFKSQNMSLNSFATKLGMEMGRAQATQAFAAGIEPSALMNPILLKPTSDKKAQVVVVGKVRGEMDVRGYHIKRDEFMAIAEKALKELRLKYDLMIIEGAGSPAEINISEQDIANMAVAKAADAPVILVADIDKGGAFASIYGTLELLADEDRPRIKGFIINKFRGDVSLLKPGIDYLEAKTGIPSLGVVPYEKIQLEAEDSVCLEDHRIQNKTGLRLAVPRLPRISNFTDLQPFELINDISVDYVGDTKTLGHPDAVIIPGTKSTLADLSWLHETGLATAIVDLAKSGVPVIGICGGYQMLGNKVLDPLGVEGTPGRRVGGLRLLPIETKLNKDKIVKQVSFTIIGGKRAIGAKAIGCHVKGYEIHVGNTRCFGVGDAMIEDDDCGQVGWSNKDLPVIGSYIHGIFDNAKIRKAFIEHLSILKGIETVNCETTSFRKRIDSVANILSSSLDIELIEDIIDSQAHRAATLKIGSKT